MGFKLNYALLTNTAGNNINWVSLPYFDNYTAAEDICTDINTVDCTANQAGLIGYFDTVNNSAQSHTCGSAKNNFNLVTGRGYSISAAAGTTCVYKLVGSHDDAYDTTSGVSFLINGAGNNINWLSIPYHATAATAENLCTQINAGCSNIVGLVGYFDTVLNAASTHTCGSAKNNFNLVPGRAYSASVSAAGSSCWHPAHY
jgi:hypothetical protein